MWPAIFFLIGIFAYYQTIPPAPAIMEVTPAAAEKIKQMKVAKLKKWYVRLEAYLPKGVSVPQYSVEITTVLNSDRDYVFESRGLKIIVLRRQVEMLRGAELDFGEKEGEEGFQVNNPNFEGERFEKWKPELELELDRPSGSRK